MIPLPRRGMRWWWLLAVVAVGVSRLVAQSGGGGLGEAATAAGAAEDRTAVAGAPRVWLAGDSTMADKDREPPNPEYGWGEALPRFFQPAVQVRNHARNGRSTKSFIDEGRWDALVGEVRAGDWVIVQFGHNDEKADKPAVYAAPRGAYQDNLRRFVREVRERGALPVLATPVMRRRFDAAGQFFDTHGDYPDAVRAVAAELAVPLLELHRLTQPLIEGHGVEGSKRLFLWIAPGVYARQPKGWQDDTHFSAYGAERVAALAVQEIIRLDLPLAVWLRE